MDPPGQVLRDLQFVLDERLVDDQLRHGRGQLPPLPLFNLALERFEIALDSVHADGKGILDREVLGVLRENRREHAWDNVNNWGQGQAGSCDHRPLNVDEILPASLLSLSQGRQ